MHQVGPPVACAVLRKDLGMYLDKALNFNLHMREKISKPMKGIGVIQKLSKTLPRHSLITIYKSFVRPHLDQPYSESCTQKNQIIQENSGVSYRCHQRNISK